MKFIHTGDLHFNKERSCMVLKVLDSIIAECKKGMDAVFICGDFWDSTISVSDASCFNLALDKMSELVETKIPIHMIYGTPSHENAGSLHCFEKIGCIIQKDLENPYSPSFTVYPNKYELVAIPEPRLSMIEGKTIEDKYKNIQKSFNDIKNICKSAIKTSPRIVLFHGLIYGAIMDNGMFVPKGETAIDKDILDGIGADYIACAHIHKRQKVGGMSTPCYYCGSLPPKNFGETHEARFNIIEI